MPPFVETLIIGGGQAGLAASYWLTRHHREHLILDQAPQAASAWRTDRWDSFTLVTPNWMLKLPGAEYTGPEPDAFMPLAEVIGYLEAYEQQIAAPVRHNVRVEAVTAAAGPGGARFHLATSAGDWHARHVIVATGLFQTPRQPSFASALPAEVTQLHSGQYRRPEALPPGPVLVVGSAQSGSQITAELAAAGRQVYLSTSGSSGRLPRRYRGRDMMAWFVEVGGMDRTVDQLPTPRAKFAGNPHVSGRAGGRTLNWHQFAREGVTLLGRLTGADAGRLRFASDLHANLGRADRFAADLLKRVDDHIVRRQLDAPAEALPELRDGYLAQDLSVLDLAAAGIRTVIWALGYRFDFSLVKLPVLDADGFPITRRGVTEYPGLYFLGLPWLHTQKSGLLFGVGEDAAHVAAHLVRNGAPHPA